MARKQEDNKLDSEGPLWIVLIIGTFLSLIIVFLNVLGGYYLYEYVAWIIGIIIAFLLTEFSYITLTFMDKRTGNECDWGSNKLGALFITGIIVGGGSFISSIIAMIFRDYPELVKTAVIVVASGIAIISAIIIFIMVNIKIAELICGKDKVK